MKVVLNTDDLLVIEDKPWFLWITLAVFGVTALAAVLTGRVEGLAERILVAGLGIGCLWVLWKFQPYQRFTFDRVKGSFTHELRRVTGRETWTRPLAGIEGTRDIRGGDGTETLTLRTSEGAYPMESGATALSRRDLKYAIDEWLTRPSADG